VTAAAAPPRSPGERKRNGLAPRGFGGFVMLGAPAPAIGPWTAVRYLLGFDVRVRPMSPRAVPPLPSRLASSPLRAAGRPPLIPAIPTTSAGQAARSALATSGGSNLPHRDRGLPPGTRRIVHLDVDAFLASVEVALHPELAGRPVIVGGLPTERNLVMSCSYEARARGVFSGQPLREAARRCPDAVFRRGDSQAANRLRERTALLLRRFTPRVEVASIDDFFVDLTGTALLHGAACDAAARMHAEIRAEVGLPVTIGIATNRTLARLAGKLGKPGGIAEILPGYEADFLSRLPVEHLPGVGHRTGAQLERFAIRTVGQLRLVSREVLFASFGRLGLLLHQRARGIDPEPVEATWIEDDRGRLRVRPPSSIRRDSTFEPEEGRPELVEAMLSYVVERASARLRAHDHCAGSVEVRVAHVDTRPPSARRLDPPPESGGGRSAGSSARRRALAHPSDSTDVLWTHARELFRSLPRRRALVKRIGVTLCSLSPNAGWQGHLFSDPPPLEPDRRGSDGDEHATSRADRLRRLDGVVDELRARLGFGGIVRGSSFPLGATHPLSRDGFRLRTPSLNQ